MNRPEISTPKDIKKLVRSIFQAIILFILLVMIIKALFNFSLYQPYSKDKVSGADNGFIAISYFGVDRDGDRNLISITNLEKQLKELYNQGYVTITQQDVINYYSKGTPIPDKSLFLMFEDGRRDTSIFAEKIIDKYNFKATMMSYGEKFEDSQDKFLSAKDLKSMEKSTLWELGTNGYQLSYINVFDRYNHYLGELSNLEFAKLSKYLGRNYNHYLMDFIRDEDMIPKESKSQMELRIRNDYELMEEIYTDGLGYLPGTYAIMHANTGAFGNNEKVSMVNQECIEDMFVINFNREGYSHNNKENSIYDLTRIQPQPHWSTNHLLMRLRDDNEKEIAFTTGESPKQENWKLIKGAAEFTNENIIITSESESIGRIKLNTTIKDKSFYFHTALTGNVLGEQTVYLRADDELNTYISIKIKNNILYLDQKVDNTEKNLFQMDLTEVDGKDKISEEEDRKEALITENEILSMYAKNKIIKSEYEIKLDKAKEIQTKSVDEGADEYVKEISLNDAVKRDLKVCLNEDKINIWIDEKKVVINQDVSVLENGTVFLQSAWGKDAYSQRNLADDVYDGVFEKLCISKDEKGKQIIYEQRYRGLQKFTMQVSELWKKVVNWFIKHL